MFSILNRALSWAITSFGNESCLIQRSRLIKALDNTFYVKFMQLEIGLVKSVKVKFKNRNSNHHDYEMRCFKRKMSAPKKLIDSKAWCPLSFSLELLSP